MTLFWSSRVSLPSTSSTRWITNMTSGRPASYSSKHNATGCCNAQGNRPSRNSVTCLLSRSTIASLPTRSMRLIWLSRLTRMHGQFSREATCSTWVDLPVPWYPQIITRRLNAKPARIASVVSRSKRYASSRSGTCSLAWLNAGTWRSLLIPKVWRTETVMSGLSRGKALAGAVCCTDGILVLRPNSGGMVLAPRRDDLSEIAGLQGGVGLVDDLQLLLGCLVAAMRIGVMQLDQRLVARLEPDQGEGRVELEDRQGLLARR